MGKVEEETSGKRAPRLLRAGALLVSWLAVCAPAAPGRAATAADNVPKSEASGKPAAEPPAPGPSAAEKIAAIQGAISRTIAAHENDIRDAYHRELVRNPAIQGEITVSFSVQPAGDVAEVQAAKSSLNCPALEEEILSRVRTWKFPPFEGRPVPATVPYMFTPK